MKLDIKSLAVNLISSGRYGKIDPEIERKIILLNIVHFTGVIALIPMGALAFYQQNFVLGWLDFLMAVVLLFNIWHLRRTGRHLFVSYFGTAAVMGLFLFLFVTGGVNNSAFVWIYTFPLFALFLLGIFKGILACVLLFTPAVIFLFADPDWFFSAAYSFDLKLRIIPSLLVVLAYSILFEAMRASAHSKLLSKNKELQKVRMELENEVQVRKRAEENAKREKRISEKANQAKSKFLANMSHELRTPLNHIIGFTELISDKHFGEINETQEEYLGDVLHSSKHLLSLVNDILDLSKVEAGKLKLKSTEVRIRELLESSLYMIKEKALKHGIQLKIDIDGIPETIHADERKLKQIMYNLLSNAAKFTQDNGKIGLSAKILPMEDFLLPSLNPYCGSRPKTKIAHRQSSPTESASLFIEKAPENLVKVSVSDTGIGLKNQELERVFESFEQMDSTMSKKHQGAGLGLALTRKLVELHGGRIWAESDGEGKGSRFCFVLPYHKMGKKKMN